LPSATETTPLAGTLKHGVEQSDAVQAAEWPLWIEPLDDDGPPHRPGGQRSGHLVCQVLFQVSHERTVLVMSVGIGVRDTVAMVASALSQR